MSSGRISVSKRILRYIKKVFLLYKSFFTKKDPNLWIFGAWFGEKYADNSRYLFEYCISEGINAVWFTKNHDVCSRLHSLNLPVVMIGSKEANRIAKKAKYNIYCTSDYDTDDMRTGGAVNINLWHGIPIKKIVYDDHISLDINTKTRKFKNLLSFIPKCKTYHFSTSHVITEIYKSCFRSDDKHIIPIGQARNDCFFDGSLQKIKYKDIPYKYVIAYMPTHRNEGKTKIDLTRIFDLGQLNIFCIENECLFLIKKHFYHRDEAFDMSKYSNIIDLTCEQIDTQELLYNTDILITDYSSCFIDYLLLNRPILFYAYDINEYKKYDRDLYFPYEEVTPGPKVTTFVDLLNELIQLVNGRDESSSLRKKIKNFFYAEENQGIVCPKLVDAIKKL